MSTKPDLLEIIRALAVGAPVDWSRLDTPADQTTRAFLRELELVSRVAEVHGTVADDATDESAATPTPTDDQPTHPHQWGTLALMERVGKGAYGEVYRAWDARLDREVALKLLDPTGDSIEGTVIEEGKSLARVRHQNVLTVHGADRIDGRVGIWAEFIEGQTLEESLQTEGPLPPTEAVNVAIDVCRGLAAVHRSGLVHGDIKAANVMREDGARVVLMDFGASASSHTVQSRRVVGTPLYMAPEVLEGQNPTIRSDVYGVGVLLYHLLTASYPTSGTTLADVRTAHRSDERRRLIDVSPNVPAPLIAVVERAIATDPAGRFESADDMAEALARVLQTQVPIPLPLRDRIAQPWRLIAILTLAVGFAAAIWAFTNHSSSTQARLDFAPRDYVLITRYENRTGETVFDGAVEYALERALGDSTIVGVVPDERIEDALALMKQPRGTIVDRRIGRDIALRDGHIKAVLAGRIERFGSDYVITTQLVDPADDAVVSTVSQEVRGKDGVLSALRQEADKLRRELGEKLPVIRGADPNVEQATTKSLEAFRLYNRSYRLGRDNNWQAALEVAREVVKADPEFASGWVWLAWAVNNTERSSPLEKRIAKYQDYLERGRQLADRVPEWERNWITGSYFTLTGQLAESISHYQALLQLRPDHFYALNNLFNAIATLHRPQDFGLYVWVRQEIALRRPQNEAAQAMAVTASINKTARFDSAKPFIDRLDALARSNDPAAGIARFDRDFAIAYAAWGSGDLAGALKQVDAIASAIDSYPISLRVETFTGIRTFYGSMGRGRDSRRFSASLQGEADRQQMERKDAFERGDLETERKLLGSAERPPNKFVHGPDYVRAGLLDQARLYIQGKSPNYNPDYAAVTEGLLSLRAGSAQRAAEQLKRAVELTSPYNHPNYWWACEALSDALSQLGRDQEAVRSLEECSNNYFKSIAVWAPMGEERSHLDLHLMDLYRRVGNLRSAETTAARIRTRLALADPDYPLLLELNKRR